MPVSSTTRFAAVDVLRGLAMVWMTVFHFCFDLQYFGYLHTQFYNDPFWTLQRTAIVSLFVLCAGLGQAIAIEQGQNWGRFWRRWRQIAGCALLVSAASRWMFPHSYIYFGILHGMALMLLLARRLAGGGRWLLVVGAVALALPWLALQAHAAWPVLDFLNSRGFNWLGLISHKPITEDYAPLFPWFGVMCIGLVVGRWVLRNHAVALERVSTALLHGPLKYPARALAWLGRWSLSYYMLHQPVLLAGFSLLAMLGQSRP
jgi:uncharacterized membrane protein